MNLPFFKNKKDKFKIPEGSSILALDIGTEVLKAVLFKTNRIGVTTLKVSRINQQQHAVNKGIIKNLNTVLENCRLAMREISENTEDTDLPKYAVTGIAGEYVQGVSIIVNYEREEKFDEIVNKKEQDEIFSKVRKQIVETGKEDLAKRTGLVNEDIEILHITVTGMEIGGMNVDSLIGLRGKNIKLYFYASFAPKTYTTSLRNVTKSLGMETLGIVSQPFAIARAFVGAKDKNFSGIFVDIGGGTTDIAIVENGSVSDTQMFAFGGRVFTKMIARNLNLDYRHAESRKIKYSKKDLDSKLEKQIKKIVYPTAQKWMRTLKSALEVSQDIRSFPPKIYLCGGGALLPDIKEVMMEYPWTKFLPFASIPKVQIFLPDKLDNLIDRSEDLKYTYDVTPASLTLFAFDKINNPENYNYI